MVAYLAALAALLITTSCGPADMLHGRYESNGTSRTATLELREDGTYEFCYRSCVTGSFETSPIDSNEGRIRFAGSAIEDYSRQIFADGFGAEEERGRPPRTGGLEVNYASGMTGTVIHIEPATEAVFIKSD